VLVALHYSNTGVSSASNSNGSWLYNDVLHKQLLELVIVLVVMRHL
jgi:hypothetical protein